MNIGRGVNIGCDRCFYVAFKVVLVSITRFIKGYSIKEFIKDFIRG